jgi:hypothetical protein
MISKHEELGFTAEEWNKLSSEHKKDFMKGEMYDPFNLPDDVTMLNPFSFDLTGPWVDGEHILYHLFSLDVWKKIEIKNEEVIKAWNYDHYTKGFIEIPKPWGAGEGQNN